MNVLQSAFRLTYEISPIILVDGIAESVPGGMLPISVFTEGLSIVEGYIKTGNIMENFTTRFYPLAGSTLIAHDIATYPFFDMATAANAVVKVPNKISMQMVRPANTINAGYPTKILTFTALQAALNYHNANGGSYTIMTPALMYTGCLMRSMIDISGFSDSNKQVQHTWQLDFEQPLLQLSELEQVTGTLMKKFDAAMPSNATWSGLYDKTVNFVEGLL